MLSVSGDIEAGFSKLDSQRDSTTSILPNSNRDSNTHAYRSTKTANGIELDEIPPIIKSTNGNLFWADEQCTRRVGLSSSEAQLFLRLLNTNEPESFEYDDYEAMFNRFGEEQKQLERLLGDLSWWECGRRQKRVWQARIEFLQHMEDSRRTLIYMLGKRRRMLRRASRQIYDAFQRKRRARLARLAGFKDESHMRGRAGQSAQVEFDTIRVESYLDATQKTEKSVIVSTGLASTEMTEAATMALNETAADLVGEIQETSNALVRLASRVRDNVGVSIQRLTHSQTHATNPRAHFPVIGAGREDIKELVELILPKSMPYIVIGWFSLGGGDPEELTLQMDSPEEFFAILRKGEFDVRGYHKFFSLKALRGFGLYKCDIARGAHTPLVLNALQVAILAQLYSAYIVSKRHYDTDSAKAWQGWVQKNLNDNKDNPLEGRYSLQLIYYWSSYRLATVVAVPLLLSLAIGSWYMMHGDVATAWTLGSYILTAASIIIALMAVIGGLNDM